MNWLENGDKGTKILFRYIKKQSREQIDQITVNGTTMVNQEELREQFFQFYKCLFSLEGELEANTQERDHIQRIIPKKVSVEMARDLGKEISQEEIRKAILSLKDDKSLGVDGLPVEFYKTFLDWVCEDLLLVYKEAFEKGTLGNKINEGIIKLIPKEGDRSLVKNWRPITLLNVFYNILAKILVDRMALILPSIINST